MFSNNKNFSKYSPENMAIWFAMAFQSGTINIGGYLACHRFVTHTTGFATLFGVEMAKTQMKAALGMISVPGFFLIGNMLAGYLIDRRLILGERPHYSLALGLMSFFMVMTFVLGVNNFFGVFGGEISLATDYSLLMLLCLTSGIQNGLVTTVSGSMVRTTHLTGLTTDLGIGIIRMLTGVHRIGKEKELQANWMRVGIITSFILGSWLSGIIFLKAQYFGFIIPAVISCGLMLISLHKRKGATT